MNRRYSIQRWYSAEERPERGGWVQWYDFKSLGDARDFVAKCKGKGEGWWRIFDQRKRAAVSTRKAKF